MGTKTLLTVLLLSFSAAPALAAPPVDSLFSDESVEIRADERLFTLMLLMNGMGWSEAAEYGPEPLKAPLFKGMRKDLIAKLTTYRERYLPNRVLNRAKRFVVQHPASLKDYVEATLHISRAPEFKMQSTLPKRLAKLKGLDGLLKGAWKDARVRVLIGRYKESIVEGQQALLSQIDKRTAPLVRLLKAKASVAPKPKAAAGGGDDDLDDLFGGDDDGDDSTASADDATVELEQVAVSLAPFWQRHELLWVRVGDRFEVIFGGSKGNGESVAQVVALVRLRSAAGLAKTEVSEAQMRAAWGLVTAATGRSGPDTLAPYPACTTAIDEWKKSKLPLGEGDTAAELIKICEPKGK